MPENKITDQTKDFYIRQIKTTKKIIKDFSNSKEFSPTILLNSLLSLVVLPYENAKSKNGERIFKGQISDLQKKIGFSPVIFCPIKSCNDNKVEYSNRTIYSFVRKFRNGIAHQNLDVSVNENKEILITIYNKFTGNNCKKCHHKCCTKKGLKYTSSGIVDFQITLSVTQLQKIANYIADSYLNSIEKHK